MIDFTNIDYLKNGNERQRKAYEVLSGYRIFEKLKACSPVLAGTIPIGIDIEESDLDVICEIKDELAFEGLLMTCFSEFKIKLESFEINGENAVTGQFMLEGFLIEIFGQKKPAVEQHAYRHMIAEYRILQKRGDDFKNRIIELKRQGIRTEPAFGILLGLDHPYEDLLKF
ncbi:DUF4269 domain-containing protein [Chryseobacterium hagamense]|uniref:Alpha/beta hydrolase n=1 Tax=Chryseobacterium hagamense TaxID=395935 RepID=A0A511YQB3_9FLAO|nr:DUF4269 domain-containing protein [Chryseobacterium hagamense]GEN77387.1 alpha/beta hydrolase [Chryseobacterium hagamense]